MTARTAHPRTRPGTATPGLFPCRRTRSTAVGTVRACCVRPPTRHPWHGVGSHTVFFFVEIQVTTLRLLPPGRTTRAPVRVTHPSSIPTPSSYSSWPAHHRNRIRLWRRRRPRRHPESRALPTRPRALRRKLRQRDADAVLSEGGIHALGRNQKLPVRRLHGVAARRLPGRAQRRAGKRPLALRACERPLRRTMRG